jgi:hypothetical protein
MVEALGGYKPKDRGLDSQYDHWIFQFMQFFQLHFGAGVYSL